MASDRIHFLHFHPVRIFCLDAATGSCTLEGWGIEGRAASGKYFRLASPFFQTFAQAESYAGMLRLHPVQTSRIWRPEYHDHP